MKKVITVKTLYTYDSAPEELKSKILRKHHHINIFSGWWESTYEDGENVYIKLGGFDLDRNTVNGSFLSTARETADEIIKNHGDKCQTHIQSKTFIEEVEKIFNEYAVNGEIPDSKIDLHDDKIEEMEEEFLKILLDEYRIMLQSEFDYKISKEAIIETIQANGYEFNADGEIDNLDEDTVDLGEVYDILIEDIKSQLKALIKSHGKKSRFLSYNTLRTGHYSYPEIGLVSDKLVFLDNEGYHYPVFDNEDFTIEYIIEIIEKYTKN